MIPEILSEVIGSATLTSINPLVWLLITSPIGTISKGNGGGVFLKPADPVCRNN
jgi:hypothetical protein